jgi:DNA-binding winged helix-turn-helix (wHTH) protein
LRFARDLYRELPLNPREVIMRASASVTSLGGVPWHPTPAGKQFHSDPRPDERHAVQTPVTEKKPFFAQRTELTRAASTEVSFGPFRLLLTQFLLLEGDKPVSLGSRALQILTVLLERPGELVSKDELMGRVWPKVFVEPANLTVHMSALRRTLRDGRDGNRFIVNVPGRGYSFVASVAVASRAKPYGDDE